MEKKTILVVDDEPSIRLLYERTLTEEGYRVETAATGEEALQKLQEAPVDLVVLDIRLQGQPREGLRVLNEIIRYKRDQKVIINSAYTSFMDDGLSWLASAYVVKSADLNVLKQHIHQVLQETGT